MSLERELRETSDSLMRALDELRELEAKKREVPTGSRRFVELAQRVEDLAIEVLRRTEREASLAEEAEDQHQAGGGTGRPIEAVSSTHRQLTDILAEWRDAERRLTSAGVASPESAAAAAEVRRLREEYRLAHEARKPKA